MGLLINRDPLFTVHNSLNGDLAIYLEERDAALDLIEDVLAGVPISHLKAIEALLITNLRASDAARALDKARAAVPDLALKLASISESEALTLADQLITAVKYGRAMRSEPQTVKLSLVE